MSHKKEGGTGSQHVSPAGKRLGLKVSSGEVVVIGQILARQRGTNVSAGAGVKSGRDHTLYSRAAGRVKVSQKMGKKFLSITAN